MSDDHDKRRAAALARLDDGDWLWTGELGALFGADRFRAGYWLKNGMVIGEQRFTFRTRRKTPGTFREVHPDDVRAALTAYEQQQQQQQGTGR